MMKKLQTKQDVERLLARFMDGTSTLEEEAQLAEFFRTHEVVGEWKEYKEMFALFSRGEVDVKPRKTAWWKYAGAVAAMVIAFGWFHHRGTDRPSLVAMTDTVKTVPQQVEENSNQTTEEVEKDTTNVAKEIERVRYHTPKVYMAKATRPAPLVSEEPLSEEDNVETTLSPEEYVDQFMAENKARMNAMMATEDPHELREEIRRRGERLRQSIEMAISNDNY